MVSKSYYQELGVSENASPEEIKRAYRELARKFHPDRNPGDAAAEERFKAIGKAFEVLSDPEKRKLYDELGEDAERIGFDPARAREAGYGPHVRGRGGKGGGFSVDPFEDLLRNFGGFGGFRGARSEPGPADGADISTEVTVGFEDAARGAERTLQLTRPERCDGCDGRGTEGSVRVCTECGGSGQTVVQQGALQFSGACPACGGAGRAAAPCGRCGGDGTKRRRAKLNVKIPAGVTDGQVVRLRGQGTPGVRGGRNGDLRITVKIAEHPYFRRDGRDVLIDVPITVPEALLGAKVEIPTLDGRVKLTVPAGTQNGAKLRLKGRGAGPQGKRGDLYAVLAVRLPGAAGDGEAVQKAARALEGLYDDDVRASLNL